MAHECIGEIALLVYNVLQQQWSTGHGVAFDDLLLVLLMMLEA